MSVTSLQRDVLAVIAGNRSEERNFAGGLVLNAADDSTRYSHDFDIFHAAAGEVTRASETDAAALRSAGFSVEPKQDNWTRHISFRKTVVCRAGESVEIDWAADSAFRFFPIKRDPLLGWRLHLFDMATNKALALSARSVTRDYVDIVELNRVYPLHAIAWAACGKDPGFSPPSLLQTMWRFARINPAQLDKIKARDLDPVELKTRWVEMADKAGTPIGVAFVDTEENPRWIGDDAILSIRPPSLRGCLPQISEPG